MKMPRAAPRDSWRAFYNQGIDALGEDELEAAQTFFDSAIRAGADGWEAFYARAWTTVQQLSDGDGSAQEGRDALLAGAREDVDRVLELFPGCADGAALGGRVAAMQGNREHAVELFLQALGRSSQVDVVEENLTIALAGLLADLEVQAARDAAESISACDRLETLVEAAPMIEPLRNELLAEVLVTRAYCRQAGGDTDQATADLRRVAQLVPQHPRIPESLPRAAQNGQRSRTSTTASDEPTFDSVGGINQTGTFTETLRGLFEAYFGDPDEETVRDRLAAYGSSPTRCLLLFGPSGCGKTYMIRSFAGEYRKRYRRELPIIRMRLNQVYGRYVGETEKSITRLVDQAIETQPSILFADEIDAMGRSREESGDWRIDIAAHWIQEVDRLRESRATVVFFGCTNRLWAIDLAMIRRFDRMIPVEMPDAEARAEVFETCLRQLESRVRPADLDIAELAEQTHGWTPGDIQGAINRSLDDLLVSRDGSASEPVLTQAGLLKALDVPVPPITHVRKWVRESVTALRDMGQDHLAADVERLYGPYIGGAETALGESGGPVWHQIPADAWSDQPQYDLFSIRRTRR
jgi:transitional endoplasmic reticulum ATPase